MRNRTKNYLSILTLILFFVMGVASTASHQTFSDADNWIPPDFNPNNTILLIQIHPGKAKQNERMIDFLEKNYPYRYEIVDTNVIKNNTGKYSDTKKYQFAVLWKMEMTREHGVSNNAGHSGIGPIITTYSNSIQYDLSGNFIDRSTKKVYPTTKKLNNYDQYGYVPFFNSITKHFK